MFGLFKKKEAGIKVIDKIWMTQDAKWKGCTEELKLNAETVFIAWFDETLNQLEEGLSKENLPVTNIFIARQAGSHLLQNKKVVFIEHYPLRSKEQSLFNQLNIPSVQIFSALDEPLFKQFGGDKIIQMMKQLGMQETASIENTMVSNAIKNAQEKIETKISFDQSTHSQTEWLAKNFQV
jgi:phosphoribosylanthranilate isomerase